MNSHIRKFMVVSGSGLVSFVLLQVVTLNKWSVWYDEGFTSMLIEYDIKSLLERAAQDVHPPLYYLALKAWSAVFGSSIVALRAFSVVMMSLVFILSLWLIVRLAGRKAAWVTLPILVLAPALIRYGQEMRMYAFAAMLGLTATHLLLALIKQRFEDKKRVSLWLVGMYAVNVALIIYTHYFASLLLLVHWVVLYLVMRGNGKLGVGQFAGRVLRREKWWVAAYVGAGILFAPWLPAMARQVSDVSGGFWIGPVTTSSFLSTLSGFLIFRPEWLNWRLSGWYGLSMLIATGVMGYFVYLIIKTRDLSAVAKTLLLGYWSIPMVILFVLSMPPLTPYYYDRYFVTFSPVFYLFLATGITLVWKEFWPKRRPVVLSAGVLIFGCLLFGAIQAQVYGNNFGHTHDDSFTMKAISSYIKDQWQPGDEVVVGSAWVYFDVHAHLKDRAIVKIYQPLGSQTYVNTSLIDNREDLIIRDLSEVRPASGRLWVVDERKANLKDLQKANWQSVQSKVDGYAQVGLFQIK